MNATHWLLLAIVLSLAIIILLCELATRGANALDDEPDYRTADGKAIERQTRKLQAQVPDAKPNPVRQAIEQINRPNLREILKKQADNIESDARDAALLDALHGTTTHNPHTRLTRAHAMWAHAYQAQQRNPKQA